MKNLFMLFTVFFPLLSFSQTQPMDTTTYIYSEVVAVGSYGDGALNAFKQTVLIDFGDGHVYGPDNPLKDPSGLEIELNSSADALTFMGLMGWHLLTSTSVYYGSKLIHHHFLKRPKFRG